MYIDSWMTVLVFTIVAFAFPIIGIAASSLFHPHFPDPQKVMPYESGEVPFGDARIKYRVHYYIFALLFLVFDVETIFLYPWAVVFRNLGLDAIVAMGVFLFLLIVGLIYEWQKGVLKWV